MNDSGSKIPRAARLEEGVPTKLQIVKTRTKRDGRKLAFANGPHNEYDSTLILLSRAQIPVRAIGQAEPQFVGHRLVISDFPSWGERVMVIPVMDTPTAHAMRKFFGREWTTLKIWNDAHEDYKVLRHEKGKDKPTNIWDFSGIFELSYSFPVGADYNNSDGTIWTSGDGTVTYELVTCHQDAGETWLVNPTIDPRLPLSMLPGQYGNRSLLGSVS